MSKENSKNSLKHKKRKSEDLQEEDNSDDQTLWASIARNYEMIQGAHIRNSFILLMALSEAKEPLSTTQLSEIISKKSKGEVFRLSASLKDSLEYRLKRDGYVEGTDMKEKSVYSITKGMEIAKRLDCFSNSLFTKLHLNVRKDDHLLQQIPYNHGIKKRNNNIPQKAITARMYV